MVKVKLGNKGFAFIDDEDEGIISHCKWYLHIDTHNQYAKSKSHEIMHRTIMNAKKGDFIDHIDGNGLNNQKSNLRVCTHGQNLANRKVVKKQSSKYLGVYKDKRCWVAGCRKNGTLHRRWVSTEELAAIEYNKMASKFHGEFARLNILPGS